MPLLEIEVSLPHETKKRVSVKNKKENLKNIQFTKKQTYVFSDYFSGKAWTNPL
jgi:hypothetical protein